MTLYTNSQNIFLAEYLSDGLSVSAPIRPLLCTGFHTDPAFVLQQSTHRFTHRYGLTDQSPSIRFSAFSADPADVKLVSQQFFGIQT